MPESAESPIPAEDRAAFEAVFGVNGWWDAPAEPEHGDAVGQVVCFLDQHQRAWRRVVQHQWRASDGRHWLTVQLNGQDWYVACDQVKCWGGLPACTGVRPATSSPSGF